MHRLTSRISIANALRYVTPRYCLSLLIIHTLAIIPHANAEPASIFDSPSDNTTANPYNVVCTYPIEGQYQLLPRLLFYFLLVFALVVRTHTWLVAGALVTAMTYAGSAALHGLVLSQKTSSYDYNASAIITILGCSSLVAAPLLSWSSTLRRFKSRPVFVYWLALICAGFYRTIITMLVAWKIMTPFSMDCGSAQVFFEKDYLDDSFFRSNNCPNPCLYVDDPPAFRDRTGSLPGAYRVSPYNVGAVKFWACFMALGFVQNMHTLFAGRRSPGHARNFLFRKMMGQEDEIFTNMVLFGRRLWYLRAALSTLVSLTLYLVMVLLTLLCIPAVVGFVVTQEIALAPLPISENFSAVGQWAPWTSTGLALLAAVVIRYHDQWVESAGGYIRRSLHGFKIAPAVPRPFKSKSERQESTMPNSSAGEPGGTTATLSNCSTLVVQPSCSHCSTLLVQPAVYPFHLFGKVIKLAINGIQRSSRRGREELKDLVAWLHHPVNRSEISDDELAEGIGNDEKDDGESALHASSVRHRSV